MASDLDAFLAELPLLADDAVGLAVDADLHLELTLAGSSTTARVTGHGQRVRVDAPHPEVLLSAVDRADVGRVADLLAAAGITVDVHGPHGPVATLGAGTGSRLGRALTGSRAVAPALRGAAGLFRAGRTLPTAAAGLAVVAAVLAALRWVRRLDHGSGPR